MNTEDLLTKIINLNKQLPIDQNVYTYWINDNLVTAIVIDDYIEYMLSGVFGQINHCCTVEHQEHLKNIYQLQLDKLGIAHVYN